MDFMQTAMDTCLLDRIKPQLPTWGPCRPSISGTDLSKGSTDLVTHEDSRGPTANHCTMASYWRCAHSSILVPYRHLMETRALPFVWFKFKWCARTDSGVLSFCIKDSWVLSRLQLRVCPNPKRPHPWSSFGGPGGGGGRMWV